MRDEQTHEERLLEVAEQRRFLAVSCAAFDAGDQAEAKRIAAVLRVLLHGRGTGPALLTELGTRDQVGWLDTAGSILPIVSGGQAPLAFVKAVDGSRSTWLPTLDAWDRRLQERPRLPQEAEETLARMRAEHVLRSRGSWLPFAEWWDADILRDLRGQTYSRSDLVQSLASTTDGPLEDVDDARHRLARPSSSSWAIRVERGGGLPLANPVFASMRQVAFEVERSLHRASPTT